ncbi:MAG TPA: HAMP domain-containing sensor histidine kinase [Candidatus Limnocylindrales bacterium]|nr:HAMP domain-containing sensor histidine kinase [Candidatus Limnocylindrales bacterium]
MIIKLPNYLKPDKSKSPLHRLFNYYFAVFLPLTALLLTIILNEPFLSTPLLIFFPIVVISTYVGGLIAGIITSILSAMILILYFPPITNYNSLLYGERIFQFILYLVESIFLSYLVEFLKKRDRVSEFKKHEKELNKKIIELDEINLNLQKEIRSRDEFLSIASHELKTPLTSMLLQTQTALHNIRNVSVARFSFESLLKMLESVENQTKRLSKMINDLLAVSVLTVGNLQLEPEDIDLNELVKGVLTDFEARIEKEKYILNFDPKDKIIGFWDKIRIEQAVSNFISNAIKYGEHKPIEIKTSKSKNHAIFSIKDQGIGISKQKQKMIFELFQRAVTPEQYKGLGVGLYITQKIIQTHQGSVEVDSNPGKGSEFKMKLPLKISQG